MANPRKGVIDDFNDIPKAPSSNKTRLPGPNRVASSSRSTSSTGVEEDTSTQFSESSSVQTQQTGTSSRLLINEGIAYHKQGQYSMALKSFFSALKSQMIDRSKDHPFLANTLANIGSTYLRQGRYQQASAALHEAMGMMQRLRKHYKTKKEMSELKLSGVLNNLGTVYFLEGDNKASMEYYREALKDSNAFGVSKKEVCNALHNIGRLHALQHEWGAAISMLNESLRMEKELYGNHSMAAVDTLNLIGFVHFSTKSYDAATVVFAEALSIVHFNCGLVHEKVATSLLNVGTVLEYQGRLDEAIHTFSTARDVFERIGVDRDHRGARIACESITKIRAVLNESKDSGGLCKETKQIEGIQDENTEFRQEPENWQEDDSSIVDSRDLEALSSEDMRLVHL
ncbi:expressed tetratricopeptide repeat protein [Nitzschia inconspicua]|uniref:Expressed tetratricopeptide repeat protein n=1 Tax=Nitzschia inconspicua TaxID=303405 RepID=A0A9K3LE07_9STRA|nr:expressed tetratricopeptide repeat protein [Nitzschia inconspicua]